MIVRFPPLFITFLVLLSLEGIPEKSGEVSRVEDEEAEADVKTIALASLAQLLSKANIFGRDRDTEKEGGREQRAAGPKPL